MAFHTDLVPVLLSRQTVVLLRPQIQNEPPFASTWVTTYDPEHLKWSLDDFSARYLCEAADTMANINWPVNRVPFLELPLSVAGGRTEFCGLTVRVLMAHDIWNDCDRMRIDATWSGGDAR
jgi:hypothetical protein